MATRRKIFGKLIRLIAEKEGIKISGFSGDWAFRLEKDGQVRFTVGYHFPLDLSSVKELCQDKCLTYEVLTAAGVRFCSADIIDSPEGLMILEVNADVMLEHFSGQSEACFNKTKEIYRAAILASFQTPRGIELAAI